MQGTEYDNCLVELFKIPFFNYLYLHITAGSDPRNIFTFDQHYTFYFCLIPEKEEICKIRIASGDKENRLESILGEYNQPLKVNLKKAGLNEYITRGDPSPMIATQIAFSSYALARVLWSLSEPPIFSIQAIGNRTAFRISSISRRCQLRSDRKGVSEKYSIIFGSLIVELKNADFKKASHFYPSNLGIKPPKFYSVPCYTFRITSESIIEKIPFKIEFTEDNYQEFQSLITFSENDLYLVTMFVISSREWDEFQEPDYNIVVQLTPHVSDELMAIAFGRSVQGPSKYVNVKVINESLSKQIKASTGHDLHASLKPAENCFNGLGKIEHVGTSIKISIVSLSTVTKFIDMASPPDQNQIADGFFKAQSKIAYLQLLQVGFTKNQTFGMNGELLSHMTRKYLSEIF